MTKNNRPILSVLVEQGKKDRFAKLAEENNLSMGWLLNQCIDKMLEANSIHIYGDSAQVANVPPSPQPDDVEKLVNSYVAPLTNRLGAIENSLEVQSGTIDWLTTQVTIQEANWKTFDELSQRVTELERATTSTAGHPSPPANKATTVTAKPSTNRTLNAEDLKMVDRLKREPALRAAAAEALAQDGTSKDVSQRLFDAGHRNAKGEAFDTTVITRMRKAIAHLDSAGED